MCGCRQFSVPQIFFELLQSFRKIRQQIVRIFLVILLFILVLTLHSNTEREDELETDRISFLNTISVSLRNESWDKDIEDETLSEMKDIPGTTSDTKLTVLQKTIFPPSLNRDFWQLTHSEEYLWSSQSLSNDWAADVSSSSYTITNRFRSSTNTCVSSRMSTSPLTVNIAVDVLGLFTVSICSDLTSFLLSICIDTWESITNYRSSDFFEEFVSITHTSTRV